MNEVQKRLVEQVDDKIRHGNELIDRLSKLTDVDGVAKVQRKIAREISFLNKVRSSGRIKEEQLTSSNLRHLAAVVDCASRPGVVSVGQTFRATGGNKLTVDVVSDDGNLWTKVIARNPKSLSALSDGNSSYGARSVVDQARDYVSCSNQHPNLYRPPKVVFEFVNGVESRLASKLENIGVVVEGVSIPSLNDDADDSDTDLESDDDQISDDREIDTIEENTVQVDTLNLDVTTMMAYISNLTNGYHDYEFRQPLLSQQAVWEAKRHVKPELDRLFEGKKLVCCQTAWDDFYKIVVTLGGPNEKSRAEALKSRLTIMPDDAGGPDEPERAELRVKGRVRLRSKIVFNFGQRIRAPTVSANEGFVRSARQQGVAYAAIVHESRALTELKQIGEK